MKYEVINQAVEINGKTRAVGTVLEESDFKPADPSAMMFKADAKKEEMSQEDYDRLVTGEDAGVGHMIQAPGELESLLDSGHIKQVN